MKRFIYLDIDGVLNGHEKHLNGYSGMQSRLVDLLNMLLEQVPDAQLVISSAWRYLVLSEQMTIKGFEAMLLTHGVNCHERVFGITSRDEDFLPPNPTLEDYKSKGEEIRASQIKAHIGEHKPDCYVVFDDLPIPIEGLLQTDGRYGLLSIHVTLARKRLLGEPLARISCPIGRGLR